MCICAFIRAIFRTLLCRHLHEHTHPCARSCWGWRNGVYHCLLGDSTTVYYLSRLFWQWCIGCFWRRKFGDIQLRDRPRPSIYDRPSDRPINTNIGPSRPVHCCFRCCTRSQLKLLSLFSLEIHCRFSSCLRCQYRELERSATSCIMHVVYVKRLTDVNDVNDPLRRCHQAFQFRYVARRFSIDRHKCNAYEYDSALL